MHTFKSLLGTALLALAMAVSTNGTQAATVSYDFSAAGAAGGGNGSFTFDDSTGAVNVFGETEFGLSDFSFSFGGSTFGLGDLDSALRVAVFDGSHLLGLELAKTGSFSLVPSLAGQDAFLVDGAGRSSSTLSFSPRQDQALPEPGTGSLALLAAVALWARRRAATAHR